MTDRPGEVLYLRDDDTGELWGPSVAPVRDESAPYHVRHGQGYSRFEHHSREIALDLLVFVPLDDPIKISRLRIGNSSARRRRLSVTAYVEWVLGTSRGASAPFVVTEIDPQTGAMFARNPWNLAFAARVAFADLAGQQTQWTGDRREFLGRHGRLEQPAALTSSDSLSGRVGAGLDPCCALQTSIVVEPGQAIEIVFLLGEAANAAHAQMLVGRYRQADLDGVLGRVKDFWNEALGTIQVKTPDRSMDIMLNRWMLYQTLVCRIWARSAFYQASGAYGFRDQLQDGMAIVTRSHRSPVSICCARPAGSSRRATCSTGGCRRPDKVFARASLTIASGSRMRRRITSRQPVTPRSSKRASRSSKVASSSQVSMTRTSSRKLPMRPPRSSSTALAVSTTASRSAHMACH